MASLFLPVNSFDSTCVKVYLPLANFSLSHHISVYHSLSFFQKLMANFFRFLKNFVFIFRERGKEGKTEGEKSFICKRNIDWLPLTYPQLGTEPATQACALTENRTGDVSVLRLMLNQLSHTSQRYHYLFAN